MERKAGWVSGVEWGIRRVNSLMGVGAAEVEVRAVTPREPERRDALLAWCSFS